MRVYAFFLLLAALVAPQAIAGGVGPSSCIIKCAAKLGECFKPCKNRPQDPTCSQQCMPDFQACQSKCPQDERDRLKKRG
ncbi:MAG: hypothetical protein HYZ28_20350 [Myxococcales bacterium]|nr:hypothetical protein [Myxococcales bacterium]